MDLSYINMIKDCSCAVVDGDLVVGDAPHPLAMGIEGIENLIDALH